MSYRGGILFSTYLNMIKSNNYGLVLQTINKLGYKYINGTTKTAYRKLHSILTTILEKLMTSPESINKYMADLVEATILVKYQAERGQLNSFLSNDLVAILNNFIQQMNNLDYESIRKHARAIKIIIDSILAFYYHKFKNA